MGGQVTDKKPLHMRDYKPRQPKPKPQPQTFPVQIVLHLMMDGAIRQSLEFNLPGQAELPTDGQSLRIDLSLNTPMLAQLVEQVMGPSSRSKLWTPGQGGGTQVVLKAKD